MVTNEEKLVEHLIVDTSAFIQNAPLQTVGKNIYTVQEVVDEITNKRQLRRLCVLPYDLVVKHVETENVIYVTDFAKKTGDYPALSATDIKVMALTYQFEKELLGVEHLRAEPLVQRSINVTLKAPVTDLKKVDLVGFYTPKENGEGEEIEECQNEHDDGSESQCREEAVEIISDDVKKISLKDAGSKNEDEGGDDDEEGSDDDEEGSDDDEEGSEDEDEGSEDEDEGSEDESEDDDSGWITPSNLQAAKKQVKSEMTEEKHVKVACMTTDFAMQNVLKQMNLNVSALDGRMIRYLKTFILRCHSCFKTTNVMTKKFCPNCGNNTLKRVAYSLDENGKEKIHINGRRPLTGRGKRFSLPTIQGGKHACNPILTEDQPVPHQELSRRAKQKTDVMGDDYSSFSPFVIRDVNAKSVEVCRGKGKQVMYWMKKNPNETRRRRK